MNAICTTTINKPTKALYKFADFSRANGWRLYIALDLKTPLVEHQEFYKQYSDCVVYLTTEDQEERWPELSEAIGFNCIQRRNFAMLQALLDGAEVLALVDDDNIPYDFWGEDVFVNQTMSVRTYNGNQGVFDPLLVAATTYPEIWHRGFPIQLLKNRLVGLPHEVRRNILVQADLWDGDPDVDAVCRIAIKPETKFRDTLEPFAGDCMGPFNSQNTFISAKAFPTYFLFPHIGRMDDIWASYLMQAVFPDSVIYNRATVFQERNEHDLSKDLEAEMIGYRHTLEFIRGLEDGSWTNKMPIASMAAYRIWQDLLK